MQQWRQICCNLPCPTDPDRLTLPDSFKMGLISPARALWAEEAGAPITGRLAQSLEPNWSHYMAMKKSEMEEHWRAYGMLIGGARTAQRNGVYRKATELALSAWKHIDGMMQYERRYGDKEFKSVEAIDMVLEYAPLLFDFETLNGLEALLRNTRGIERYTSDNLSQNLAATRGRMWDCHRMWDYLERHGETEEGELLRKLGGPRDVWGSVTRAWENMGLLRRRTDAGSYKLALSTRLGEVVAGKCPVCGTVAEAPKAIFLEESLCPQCQTRVLFVLLSPDDSTKPRNDP